LRPRVIRVLPVNAGETPESFARRMASDHPLEQFLELNGLAASQALRPGSAVKIVTYR
jgi:predicted Zn-dependent protease